LKREKNWKNIEIQEQQYLEISKLCEEAVKRYKDPSKFFGDNCLRLADGVPGMLMMYNEIQKVLKIPTNKLMYDYIEYTLEKVDFSFNDFSLYNGISGFNYAIRLINRDTGSCIKLLQKMDGFLLTHYSEIVDELLLKKNVNSGMPLLDYEYDIINGITGTARYLIAMLEDKNNDCYEILFKISNYLVECCLDKVLNDKAVEGWICQKTDVDNEGKLVVENSYEYNLGLSHGVPCILSILSLLFIHDINRIMTKSAIIKIVTWFNKMRTYVVKEGLWPAKLNEDYSNYYGSTRVAWCYGNPGIASSLNLAAKALKSTEIDKFAQETLRSIFYIPTTRWNVTSPMICHGYAGILQILYEVGNQDMVERENQVLIDKLLNCISYEKTNLFINNDLGRENSTLGFLEGTSGIILSLLNTISKANMHWAEILLLK
jgi:hypothetical protein